MTLEDVRLVPNETADAFASASLIRRREMTLDFARAGGPTGMSARSAATLYGEIVALRTGIKEDEQDIVTNAVINDAIGKLGSGMLDISDAGLSAMGISSKKGSDS